MGACSQTSGYLKVATVGIIVAVILHIAGLATYQWSHIETEITITGYSFQTTITYLIGLWRHCYCLDLFGQDTCQCSDIEDPPGWLSATKALASIASVGMIIGGLMAFISSVMSTPNKQLKIGTVVVATGAGLILITAIIIYGIESKKHIDQLLAALEYIDGLDFYSLTKFGFSFILSTCAACLLLAICVPLFIIDIKKKSKQINTVPNTGIVQYGNQQVQIIAVPIHQGPGYGYGIHQGPSYGYGNPGMQPQQPPAYSGPGAPPPPQGLYNQQQHPGMAPAPFQADGIPPKS